MTRRSIAFMALVAAAASIVAVAMLRGGGDPEPAVAPPSRFPRVPGAVADARPDREALALTKLLEEGRTGTFHARYRSTDPAAAASELQVEVWRKAGRVRQDTVLETPTGTGHTAGFLHDGQSVACSRTDDGPWTCHQDAAAVGEAASVDSIFGTPAEVLDGVNVTEARRTVGGMEARCFTFAATDGPATLCFGSGGIPLSLSAGDKELMVVEVILAVDDAAFVLPAAVS
jgi:hypothetical protein